MGLNKTLVLLLLVLTLSGIGVLFWQQEIKYNLPTPAPSNYHPPAIRTQLDLRPLQLPGGEGPVFVHFFNPDCPCSRFNLKEFKTLTRTYGDRVRFAIVFQTDEDGVTASRLSKQFDLNIPAVIDRNGKIADSYGVYSTPQAVILDENRRLYYRGNYNRTRYCTHPNTAFAQNALEALLDAQPLPLMPELATRAYGCELPRESIPVGSVP